MGQPDLATIATVFGGPALFLAGHALFRYTVFGVRSGSRLVAIALLVGLIPVAAGLSPLVIGLATTLVVASVAVHESVFHPAATGESISVERG